MSDKLTAADTLRKWQKQCDPEGIEVQVSRQALDEVLDALEAKDAEIEGLKAGFESVKAGFESEESQEYCHNEVTGLHNMADLYEIEHLQSRLRDKQNALDHAIDYGHRKDAEIEWLQAIVNTAMTALKKLSRLGNEPHLGNSDGNVIAQKALKEILENNDE